MVSPSDAGAALRRMLAPTIFAALMLLGGCAMQSVRQPATADAGPWTGRMALSIQSEPVQTLSAGFELSGNPGQGELQLFSPLGTTVAVLSWSPGKAILQRGDLAQSAGTLDELVAQATGTAIPVKALFDWLHNRPTEVNGWQADLSHLNEGRLQLRRASPLPAVELRLKLDQ
jgi:outer membrane lipoprotein LolB